MWILTVDYKLIQIPEWGVIGIYPTGSGGEFDQRVMAGPAEEDLRYTLLECKGLDTASQLIDDLANALRRNTRVFSMLEWIEKIESDAAARKRAGEGGSGA